MTGHNNERRLKNISTLYSELACDQCSDWGLSVAIDEEIACQARMLQGSDTKTILIFKSYCKSELLSLKFHLLNNMFKYFAKFHMDSFLYASGYEPLSVF